jgi:hypothetical protein
MLYSGRGFLSRMIRRITGSKWSHAAWVFDKDLLIESDWEFWGAKGIQFERMDRYPTHRCVFLRPKVEDAVLDQCVDFAQAKLQERYDWSLFFGIFRAWVSSMVFFWRKPKLRNQRHGWICSELIAIPLWKFGAFKFVDEASPEENVPNDIWRGVANGRAEIQI